MGGFQLAVSRYSKHPREAVQVISWLTGSEVQLRRAIERGYLPTIPTLYGAPELSRALPHVKALRSAGLQTWVARPSTATGSKYADVSRAYSKSVHAILSARASAEEALAGLEKGLTALTSFPAGPPAE
jgi:trehalose/maltose transport system substrate-binding protein